MENPENNSSIIEFLKAELEKDPVPSFFIEMTKLGLVEITRKKIKKPLHEAFSKTMISSVDKKDILYWVLVIYFTYFIYKLAF